MSNEKDPLRRNNTSGHRGVSYSASGAKYGRPWYAYVQVDGRSKSLGLYSTVEKAAAARQRWDENAELGTPGFGPSQRRRGSNHPNARLTEDQVRDIRQLADGYSETQAQIAARFGVSRPTVAAIISRRIWKE